MAVQSHPTPAPWADPSEAELVALAVAVGILPDRPVEHVAYDWTTGALVKVPTGSRRAPADEWDQPVPYALAGGAR